MSTLQSAPPAEAPKGGNFVKLPPIKKSDTYVMTIVGYNYIESHPFDRKDQKTGKEYVQEAPAVELFFGTLVNGEPAFVKSWPQMYSISDRANYRKWYEAATGTNPRAGSKPDDIIGKALLVEIKAGEKTSQKGTTYIANKIGTVSKVPSILEATIIPLTKLKPALEAILAKSGEGKDNQPEGNDDPF